MHKKLYYFQLVILLTGLWLILFEKITILLLLSGLFFSIFSLYFSEKYLVADSFYVFFPFNIFKLIRYAFFMLFEIYKSGISIIPYIISGNVHPGFVDIYTELESNLDIVILANSITLTPGTITVDVQGHSLQVLWINPTTTQPTMAGIKIKGSIEKKIKEGL
ncbi:Na+/H+ antiporter subunit E [Fusibacter bizertensis]